MMDSSLLSQYCECSKSLRSIAHCNVNVWAKKRNRQRTEIKCEFTAEKADAKLSKYYAI